MYSWCDRWHVLHLCAFFEMVHVRLSYGHTSSKRPLNNLIFRHFLIVKLLYSRGARQLRWRHYCGERKRGNRGLVRGEYRQSVLVSGVLAEYGIWPGFTWFSSGPGSEPFLVYFCSCYRAGPGVATEPGNLEVSLIFSTRIRFLKKGLSGSWRDRFRV